jgi:hypothetical protein
MPWSLADMPERSRFVVPMQGDVARTRGEVTVHAAIAGSIVLGVAKLPVSSASARSGPHYGPGLRCAACCVPGTSKYRAEDLSTRAEELRIRPGSRSWPISRRVRPCLTAMLDRAGPNRSARQ